jgi:hypothetical protein
VTWLLVAAGAALALAACLIWDVRALYVRQLTEAPATVWAATLVSGRGCFHHRRYCGDCPDCVLVAHDRELEGLS